MHTSKFYVNYFPHLIFVQPIDFVTKFKNFVKFCIMVKMLSKIFYKIIVKDTFGICAILIFGHRNVQENAYFMPIFTPSCHAKINDV